MRLRDWVAWAVLFAVAFGVWVLALTVAGCGPRDHNAPTPAPALELELVHLHPGDELARLAAAEQYVQAFRRDWLRGPSSVRKLRILVVESGRGQTLSGPPVCEIRVPAGVDDTLPVLPHELFHAYQVDLGLNPSHYGWTGDPWHDDPAWGGDQGVGRHGLIGAWWESVLLGVDPWEGER